MPGSVSFAATNTTLLMKENLAIGATDLYSSELGNLYGMFKPFKFKN